MLKIRLIDWLVDWLYLCVSVASRADFCLHESFNASCRPGSVVLMTSASYGRMRLGRCIVGDYNIGCSTNVVAYMHGQCTGRPACDVPVRNLVDTHPCQRDFMSYLEATYICIEGTLMCIVLNGRLIGSTCTHSLHSLSYPRSSFLGSSSISVRPLWALLAPHRDQAELDCQKYFDAFWTK